MTNAEEIRAYFILRKGVTECFPFDEVTLVFKVGGKMFGLLALDENPPSMNLKSKPEKAIQLREQYSAVKPGYHMNKVHWNTVIADGSIPALLMKQMIDESYELVLDSLPKKAKEAIK
jgi:predicted DNA-binding protein (MmcQ/YjbR family)